MSQYLLTPYAIPDPTVTTHAQVVKPLSPVRAGGAIQVSEFDGELETRNQNSTDLLCCGLPIPIVMTTSRTSGPRSRAVHILKLIITFLFDRFPRQLYLSALLYLPTLYYTRVTRILEDAEQMIPAVRKLYSSDSPQQETASFIASFKVSWELFVDSIMREWNTLNIVSVLLLSYVGNVYIHLFTTKMFYGPQCHTHNAPNPRRRRRPRYSYRCTPGTRLCADELTVWLHVCCPIRVDEAYTSSAYLG
jgi:hypothetical protein